MASEYAPPAELLADIQPDRSDLDYAHQFELMAKLVQSCTKSDMVALRLSTCRNIYLTINAVFIDLQYALGHGSMPSTLSHLIEALRRKDYKRAKTLYAEAREAIAIGKHKLQVWDSREDLDAEIGVAKAAFSLADRGLIDALLNEVRTSTPDAAQSWDREYYRWSSKEYDVVRSKLIKLRDSYARVEAILNVAYAYESLAVNDDLFAGDRASVWAGVFDALCSNNAHLDIILREDAASWTTSNHEQRIVERSWGSPAKAEEYFDCVLEHLKGVASSVYEELTFEFRPNVGVPPLPQPFVLDLSQYAPGSMLTQFSPPKVLIEDDQKSSQPVVKVARLDCGIPLGYFNIETARYTGDDRREEVRKLVRAAISDAAAGGAQLIAIPEYVYPRGDEDELPAMATEKNIIVIAGLEGRTIRSGGRDLLVDEVRVCLPGRRAITQFKERPSVYEPTLWHQSEQKVYFRTTVGTFAVVLCSDYREADTLSALASSPTKIDLLVVCSFNPNPPQYVNFAMTDCHRLYTHIFIANNYAPEASGSASSARQTSAFGSGVASPRKRAENSFDIAGVERRELALPDIGGGTPAIVIHELRPSDVKKGTDSPEPGFSPCPRCMRPG